MPRPPRNGVVASKRMIVLVTPRELLSFGALARFRKMTLAALVRSLLTRDRAELESAGKRVPKR